MSNQFFYEPFSDSSITVAWDRTRGTLRISVEDEVAVDTGNSCITTHIELPPEQIAKLRKYLSDEVP